MKAAARTVRFPRKLLEKKAAKRDPAGAGPVSAGNGDGKAATFATRIFGEEGGKDHTFTTAAFGEEGG
jgi:hypothetical protein